MPVRTITTSLKLDGEQEFKKQLGNVNRELRNLDSEMKLVTAQFEGQANSMEALTAKGDVLQKEYDQTAEKVRALEKALADSTEAYGEADERTDKYRQSLNRAKTDLIELERELKDNERYLDEARKSADKAATSIDGFGKEVRDAGGDLDGIDSGFGSLLSNLGNLKNALVGGAVVTGLKEISGAIIEVVDSTQEYRSIMGTLEVSSQAAGYSAEETAAAFDRLFGVLGDTQSAATTVANLQAIGLEQDQLMQMLDAAVGAWATYGDSIPIDQMAESINLASQQSEISSGLADALEWAGVNVDEFKASLEAANSTEERANLILQELSRQGLTEASEAWRTVNDDIVKTNESQARLDEAWGKMGETLAPLAEELRNFAADALSSVADALDTVISKIGSYISKNRELRAEMEAQGASQYGTPGYQMQATADEASTMRVLTSTPARAAQGVTVTDLQNVAASTVNAMGTMQGGSQPITLNATLTMDGAVVARKQYHYNQMEAQRHGKSLVNK